MSAKPRRIVKPVVEEKPKETIAPIVTETKPAGPEVKAEKKKDEGHGPLGEPVSKNNVYI